MFGGSARIELVAEEEGEEEEEEGEEMVRLRGRREGLCEVVVVGREKSNTEEVKVEPAGGRKDASGVKGEELLHSG